MASFTRRVGVRPFDTSGKFIEISSHIGLSGHVVRSAGITIFSQAGTFGIQLVGTAILGRLLSPSDFGIVTIVTTVSLFLSGFGLNGFSDAIIQIDEITHSLASNLFWITSVAGVALAIAFCTMGSLLAKFFADPVVADVANGMALTILFSNLSVLHLSLLRRAMHYSLVSVNDIVSKIVYVLVGVAMALAGYRYWALVGAAVAQSLSILVGSCILCRWCPGFPRRDHATGRTLRFAMSVYGRFGLNYMSRNSDNVLVGRFFGPHQLGFYKKAYDLFILPSSQLLSPVASVAVTALSRLNKKHDEYRKYFLKALSLLAFVAMAVSGDLVLIGRDLVRLLLGPGWEPAGKIFTYFAPGIGFMLIYVTSWWIYLSTGRPDRWLRWTIVEACVTASLFIPAIFWGPEGFAVAWTVSYILLAVPSFWYAGQQVQLTVSSIVSALWQYVAAATTAALLTKWITDPLFQGNLQSSSLESAIFRIAFSTALFGGLYLLATIILHRSLAPVRHFVRILPEFVPGARRLLSSTICS